MIVEDALNPDFTDSESNWLDVMRTRINDENYLHAAIQRLALVMSNEIMETTKEGGQYERKRRK